MLKEDYLKDYTLPDEEHVRRRFFTAEQLKETVITDKMALLILDFQRYFTQPDSHAYVPSAGYLEMNIQNLLKAAETSEMKMIFTKHINDEHNSGMMSKWWKDTIRADSPLSELTDKLMNITDKQIIVKTEYDAFLETQLEEILKSGGIEKVIITGLMTHLCCETTARSAFMHGFEVLFPIDGTATYNRRFHDASMLNLAHGFANLCTVGDITRAITGAAL